MDPTVAKVLVSALPVIACLAAFEWVDAFKLISTRDSLLLVGAGALMATAGFYANGGVLDQFPIGVDAYSRFGAPVVEEALKAVIIIGLFAFNRIGYLVDAAIAGFAVGSGFALAENLFFLQQFSSANLGVSIIRGFGTAIMHGGVSALMAAMSLALFAPRLRGDVDRFRLNPLLFLPGLALAAVIHSAFNQFQHTPVLAMAIVLLVVPLGLFVVLSMGESRAHRWLVDDRRSHVALLADIRSGAFAQTAGGKAIDSLAARLGPERGADLLDYVHTHVELVARAEDTLLALEEHEKVALDAHLRERLHHLHHLERRLGHAPVMAVRQHLHLSRDDLWKLHELEEDSSRRALRA